MKKLTQRNIGNAATQIGGSGATPATGKVWTVFSVSLCNKAATDTSIDLFLREPGPLDTYILKTFTIPAKNTHFTMGGLAKQVMAAGDGLFALSSVTGIDIIVNYIESDAV